MAADGSVATLYGITSSDDLPLTPGALQSSRRERDLFIAKLSSGALDVILPRGTTAYAQMAQERRAAILTLLGAGEEAPAAAVGGGLLKTLLISAGAGTVGVATWEVVDNSHGDSDDDKDKDVVSP